MFCMLVFFFLPHVEQKSQIFTGACLLIIQDFSFNIWTSCGRQCFINTVVIHMIYKRVSDTATCFLSAEVLLG